MESLHGPRFKSMDASLGGCLGSPNRDSVWIPMRSRQRGYEHLILEDVTVFWFNVLIIWITLTHPG